MTDLTARERLQAAFDDWLSTVQARLALAPDRGGVWRVDLSRVNVERQPADELLFSAFVGDDQPFRWVDLEGRQSIRVTGAPKALSVTVKGFHEQTLIITANRL